MRLLDAHGVAYEVLTFSPDIHSATEVAEVARLDPDTVYKTLVVRRARGTAGRPRPLLVMVAGDRQVNLKALAASLGEKKLSMATHDDAERLTGLQVGGISALTLLSKGFDVCIDLAARRLDRVAVSAGRRGIDVSLAVSDLVQVTRARWVDATGEDLESLETTHPW